ncbi:MAG: hypothetical protein J4N98_07340, partial [Chloroflexi bacterium]|nr:hypothetical protein [Chloroflexota bacterium]
MAEEASTKEETQESSKSGAAEQASSNGEAPARQPGFPPIDMSWANAPTQRGMRPTIGPDGLTLALADTGSYGDAPDHWPYENDAPRGAYMPLERMGLPAGYTIFDKVEVWADNCADLYEDAIRDRWASATAIPWEALERQPAHIEQAISQLCTNWSEDAHVGFETLAGWLEEISYGYHEVKLYLATVVFDLARHTETFRKRALANGGSLGVQRPGFMHRSIGSALKFTEFVINLNVVRTSFMLSLIEQIEPALAHNDADRTLYRQVGKDLKRHLAYGLEHLHYFLAREPQKRPQVNVWLSRAEAMLGAELRRNVPYNEALVLLLDEEPKAGVAKLAALRRTQVEDYLDRLAETTMTDRRERLARSLH